MNSLAKCIGGNRVAPPFNGLRAATTYTVVVPYSCRRMASLDFVFVASIVPMMGGGILPWTLPFLLVVEQKVGHIRNIHGRWFFSASAIRAVATFIVASSRSSSDGNAHRTVSVASLFDSRSRSLVLVGLRRWHVGHVSAGSSSRSLHGSGRTRSPSMLRAWVSHSRHHR